MWETWVQSLGWEDPLEEGMATHSSILAWRIPMDTGAWQATVHGVTKSQTWLGEFYFTSLFIDLELTDIYYLNKIQTLDNYVSDMICKN